MDARFDRSGKMSENAAVLRDVTFRYANGEQGALNSIDLLK